MKWSYLNKFLLSIDSFLSLLTTPIEPTMAEPVDMLNLTDILTSIETKQEQVKEAIGYAFDGLPKLMQIQNTSCVISILTHRRDLLTRLKEA